jgi:hypothetical protein
MSRRKIAEQMVMRETRGAPAGASRRLRKSPDAREITVDRGNQSRFSGFEVRYSISNRVVAY